MKSYLLIIGPAVFVFLSFLPSAIYAQTPSIDPALLEKASKEFYEKICSGHGGVDCSVMTGDASVICKDGTIDTSLPSVYNIPWCQDTILKITEEQSDFMAESGCFPPSELRCYDNNSYDNLVRLLSKAGLLETELGKHELSECLKQIDEYKKDLTEYKECLVVNNRPDFELYGKSFLPVIKAAFCPLFYGNATYFFNADLCVCDKDYVMEGEACVKADKICRDKYGPDAYANGGDCIRPKISAPNTPVRIVSVPSATLNPSPRATPERSVAEYTHYPEPPLDNYPETNSEKPGLIKKIFDPLISIFRKMLKLF